LLRWAGLAGLTVTGTSLLAACGGGAAPAAAPTSGAAAAAPTTAAAAAAPTTAAAPPPATAAPAAAPTTAAAAAAPTTAAAVGVLAGPPIASPFQKIGPQWEAATGAKINLITFPFTQVFEKLRAGVATGSYTFDLIVISAGWAGDFMGGGFVEPVPDDVKAAI